MKEEELRSTLDLSPTEALNERGVYPPDPRRERDLVERPPGEYLEPGEVLLSPEWLDDNALEEHFSEDARLSDALPAARVLRADVEPRLLVFDNVPEPSTVYGEVRRVRPGTWVMDSRESSAVRFPYEGQDIIAWGEVGTVRLFQVRPRPS